MSTMEHGRVRVFSGAGRKQRDEIVWAAAPVGPPDYIQKHAILFLFCRLIVGPPLVYKTVVNESNTYIVKIGALGILIVSLMWGWKIIMMIVRNVRKLFGGAKAKKA